jgi:hypothetical protein
MNSYGQFGIEAQIPINRATGTDTGTPAQVRFFFDDISANSIGKPLFRRHRSSLMKLHTRIRAIVAAPMVAACQFAHAHAYPVHQMSGAGSTVSASQKDVAIDHDEGRRQTWRSSHTTRRKRSTCRSR